MRIQVTFDFDIDDRLAIANLMGDDRPALYGDCKTWIKRLVRAALEELSLDVAQAKGADNG